jgi:hypothetical protein
MRRSVRAGGAPAHSSCALAFATPFAFVFRKTPPPTVSQKQPDGRDVRFTLPPYSLLPMAAKLLHSASVVAR